jgi:hypothetical protein
MKMMKKDFLVSILAMAIVAMKMMKKKFVVLILAIAIIASASVVAFISFGEAARNGTVLGITLGKSLGTVGLRECRRSEGPYSFKSYDNEDANCYQITDCESDACFTQVIPELSFDITIDVILLNNCDRESPVQEIRATFGSGNYEKVLPLVVGKFGKPKKTEKSVVQNSVGVEFHKIESFWNKRGLSIYMTNMYNETGWGRLEIIRQDKKRSVAQTSQKESASDRKIF